MQIGRNYRTKNEYKYWVRIMQNIVTSITEMIHQLSKEKKNLIIAIDGRCAAGKTTLAAQLQEVFSCNVIHMDHFFLRTEQRTEERLNTPGENIDHERFLEEVLVPLRTGNSFTYRPYDCRKQRLSEEIMTEPKAVNIIEGSYSCHSALWEYYDLRVFLTVSQEEQLRRIIHRDGTEKAEIFKNKWIPLEEYYFSSYEIDKRCDFCFET